MTEPMTILTALSAVEADAAATKETENKLIAVLGSDAPQKEKVDACRQLGVIGTKDAVPALAALLGDEKLSHMARYGLEPIPDASVDAALRDALDKLKGRPLVGVVGSLGVRRDPSAAALLAKLLDGAEPDVAPTAARSLGKIGTPEAANVLSAALAKAAARLRVAVAEGCLDCAEQRLAEGKRDEAVALCQAVAKADLPKHFRIAAAQGMILSSENPEKR